MKPIFLASVVLMLACFNSAAKVESDIVFYTENYPPANFVEEGQVKGISVDTLDLIWQQLQLPKQDIVFVPWARGYRTVLEKNNTAIFTMSRTPARDNLFKWVGPLFSSVHVLMAKKDKHFEFDNLGQVFQHRVATIRGDISEISLQQIGYPDFKMAKLTDLKHAFQMLEKDRVEMMMVSIHGFTHLTKQLGADASLYEVVWTVNKIGNYIAFNINTPDEVIDRYQRTFDSLAEERAAIKRKYQLSKKEY